MPAKKTLKKAVGGKATKKVTASKSKAPAAKKVVKKVAAKVVKKAPKKVAAPIKKKVTKPQAKKAAVKKPVNKAAVKKAIVKKAPAKKAVVKKAAVKKAVVKNAEVKKVPAKKVVLKKEVIKKAPEKKASPVKEEKKVVKETPKKVVEKKSSGPRKPSLGGPAPVPAVKKARFVPPPAAPVVKISSNGGGSHTPAFIQKQHQRLLELRDTLVDSMSGMTRDTIRNAPEGSEASGSGQHQGDAGSDAYDRDFALSVLAKEQDALYEIEQALRRIKNGTYGKCEISEQKIPIARLEAIPFARLTVECQAQWEKEYGNRRFRPSDEVGFSGGIPQEDEDSVTVSLDGDDD